MTSSLISHTDSVFFDREREKSKEQRCSTSKLLKLAGRETVPLIVFVTGSVRRDYDDLFLQSVIFEVFITCGLLT